VPEGKNWVTLSLEDINTETWSLKLGVTCKAIVVVKKKIIVVKIKEVKNRIVLFETNPAGYSKEGHGSKRGCFDNDDDDNDDDDDDDYYYYY
jgi:hypothetical protein